MDMVFYTSHTTPLYSTLWTPSTTSTYALTCLFLILLSILFRSLLALKSYVETRWSHNSRRRRYIVVASSESSGEQQQRESETVGYRDSGYGEGRQGTDGAEEERERLTATLTARGVDEKVHIVEASAVGAGGFAKKPWRLSVDLPRALLYTIIVGIGYLE